MFLLLYTLTAHCALALERCPAQSLCQRAIHDSSSRKTETHTANIRSANDDDVFVRKRHDLDVNQAKFWRNQARPK